MDTQKSTKSLGRAREGKNVNVGRASLAIEESEIKWKSRPLNQEALISRGRLVGGNPISCREQQGTLTLFKAGRQINGEQEWLEWA